jgi:hypothetical protein
MLFNFSVHFLFPVHACVYHLAVDCDHLFCIHLLQRKSLAVVYLILVHQVVMDKYSVFVLVIVIPVCKLKCYVEEMLY